MDTNPYSINAIPVSSDTVEARIAFLRRTYSLLLAGVLTFAATLWAAGANTVVTDMAVGLWKAGWLGCMLALMGGGFAVRALARRAPINLVAYFGYSFLLGLLLAPIVLFAAHAEPDVLVQAAVVTALVFSGLTAYAFTTRKDFSFLGGALWIGSVALMGVLALGWLFDGFTPGLWFAAAGVLLFSGYVLYDTSRVLHHFPSNAHVAAAIELLVGLIMLFQYVLFLLLRLNDD